MTDYQDALVLENLELVNWVIRTRISIPNRPLLTYDDFYAIGCEAICRAALKYQPDMGAFAPFACRYIYNAIVDHCRAMNYRLERSVEISEDENASLLDIHRKRHAIVLELENGSQVQRVLDGRYKLKAGSLYRFYLKKPTNDLPNLPEALQPSSTVFGFEELSFSTSKQI